MFEAIRRDVRMVVDGLRGRSPSPLVKRGRGAVYGVVVQDSAARARTVEVVAVVAETRDAVTLALREVGGAQIGFVPGQFLTVMVEVEGQVMRRAYSISAGAGEALQITVKRVEGGRVSSRLVAAEVGMRLQVLGPSGEFTAGVGAGRHLVAIAGGSGITPIMSIARSVLAAEPESRVTLVYGNRTEADVIFAAELARMMAASGGRFAVEHVLGERMEVACVADADGYFVCGPEPMMVAARARLLAMGVDAARIKEERFSAPARRQEAQVTSAQPVTIRRAGVAMDVIVPAGQTLLDAGLAAGVPMKLSCAMGGCGACAVRLTAGEVVMDEPNCLGDAERARGLVLACVARPLSPCTVETEVQP